jgi:hypothetical protein
VPLIPDICTKSAKDAVERPDAGSGSKFTRSIVMVSLN